MHGQAGSAEETDADRLRQAIDLFEVGLEMFTARYRRENPEADEVEVDAAVADWLQDRPDAPHGDYPGPPSPRQIPSR